MEQRKFKNLKNRLDSMNYKYPFTLDSATLIEALLSDVINLNQSLQKLRVQKSDSEGIRELSERIEYLNREKLKLEEEIQKTSFNPSAYDEKEGLMLSISELKRENKFLSQKLSDLQTTKKENIDSKSKEYIEKLFADFNYVKKQLEESEENVSKLVFENRGLSDRVRSLENQNSSLRKEVEVSLFTIKDITNENRSATEEFYSLKKVISSYESKIAILDKEVDLARTEQQKVLQANRGLEQQVSSLNKEYSKSRNELEMATSSKVRVSSQVDSLQRQVDILQNENNKLHSLRDEDRNSFLAIEQKYFEAEENLKSAQEKIRVIQRESQGFCETIREKGEEIRNKEHSKKNLEKELKELKVYVNKFEESQQEVKKFREANEENGLELRKTKQELNETRGNLKYKEEDAKQYKKYLEQANRDLEVLKRKLEEEIEKNSSFSQCVRSNAQLEEQVRNLKSQIDDSITRERNFVSEIDQFRILLQKTEEKLNFSHKQYEIIQNQRNLMEQENSKFQKSLSELTAKESSKSLEISRFESRIEQNLIEIDELKKQGNKSHEEILFLQEELRDLKKAYMAEQSHVSRQSDQISQLKEFISSVESSRNDLLKKMENLQMTDLEKESLIKRLKEEINTLRKNLTFLEKTVNEAKEERENAFKQIENLKFDITRRNDEILGLKNSIKKYISDIEEIKFKAKSIQESEEDFKRSWRDSEIEKSRLNEINLALNLQLEDSKKIGNKMQMQFSELNQELKQVENELKKYQEKYKILMYEKESLIGRVEELNRDLRGKIELLQNVSCEKDEYSQKLRLISDEYDKLVRAYDYLNLDFKSLSGKLMQLKM